MIMFAPMGLGILANLVSHAAAQPNAMQAHTPFQTLHQAVSHTAHEALPQAEDLSHNLLHLSTPAFPEHAAHELTTLQQQNAQERNDLISDTKQELADKKQALFEEHHLETKVTPQGKHEVVVDDQGKPKLQKGPEAPHQREARETFEADTKTQIDEKHATQRQDFVQEQKHEMTQFLQENKPDLGNPAVQGELQKMVMQSHKKALLLGREQDAEHLKAGLYTADQHETADAGLAALHQLEDKHAQQEDSSPAAQQLLAHHQDTAEVLRQRRDEARQEEQANLFLKGRPNFAASPANQETDVAKVLPAHLSNALYQLGIYTV
jgi:hypothetical protein